MMITFVWQEHNLQRTQKNTNLLQRRSKEDRDQPVSTSLRILLVENNASNELAFRKAFEESDVASTIHSCADAAEALEQLGKDMSYDLLVINHSLPGLDGLGLCKKLLSQGTSLAMTLMVKPGEEQKAVEALKAGVDLYVMKDEAGSYLILLPGVLTELVARKQLMINSLAEKDIQMREIHHRIKNNLQVISGLLYKERNSLSDPQDIAVLAESQKRVQCIAVAHENMCRAANMTQVNMHDYLHRLVSDLLRTYGASPEIQAIMSVEELVMNPKKAIPCGLLVNEVVTNSLKYAFPDGQEGTIRVSLHQLDGEAASEVTLTISDDGIGLPDGFDIEQADTVGLQLVRLLSAQLNRNLDVTMQAGTTFRITFPL